MSNLEAFRRPDGTVGIRNHLFILPAVVCANQVAIDMARRHPRLKYIEHQHGCAQIGADLEQTRRIFTHLALHPNVYSSMFVSLGCEGLVTKNLVSAAKSQTTKPLELVVIQDSGGTLGAELAVQKWLDAKSTDADQQQREPVSWNEIVIGLLFDYDLPARSSTVVERCLSAIYDLGARVVTSTPHVDSVKRFDPRPAMVGYGHAAESQSWVMEPGSTALETATGLTAAGAHLILHLSSQPHAFASPLAPTVRWSVDEQTYHQFCDDFDGHLNDELDIPRLTEQLTRIIQGEKAVAEELGMDDFALYRVGPSV